MDDEAENGVGKDCGAEQVGAEADESDSCAGSVLRHEVHGLDGKEHDGTVDEESDADEEGDGQGGVSAVAPVEEHEEHGEEGVDDVEQRATAFEDTVGEPAAEEGAGDGGELVGKVGPACVLDVEAVGFGEIGGRPVEAAVADHEDEGVGQTDAPEELVGEDVFGEYLFDGECFFRLFAVVVRIVVLVFLDGAEALALRGVADEAVGYEGDEECDGCGEGEGADEEVAAFVDAVEPAAEPEGAIYGHGADEGAADVVAAVPDARHGAALGLAEPVGDDAGAGRIAHAVEPSHEGVEHAHHYDAHSVVLDVGDGDYHEAHAHGCTDEAKREELAGVATVAHGAHEEPREGVGEGIHGEHDAQLAFFEAELFHEGHGHAEVFAHQIETGIGDECTDEDLPAQGFVFLGVFLLRKIRRL